MKMSNKTNVQGNKFKEIKLEESTCEIPAPTTDKDEYNELCQLVNLIAHPLANRKLAKKIYKLIKKASQQKDHLKHGLGDVQKALRKEEKGFVILAGNVSPIDIYSHIPALCEEKELPYIFLPSREHLGLAAGHKRPSIALLVKQHESYDALYEEIVEITTSLVLSADNEN